MGGMLVFTITVILANLKLLIFAYKNAIITLIVVFGSIIVYFITFDITNNILDDSGFEVLTKYSPKLC